MAADFAKPVGAERQVSKAAEIFKVAYPPSAAECLDPATVDAFMRRIAPIIKAIPGMLDFRGNRLNREQRRGAGLDLNHRQYNKRFRILARMEDKIARMMRNAFKYDMARSSKSGMATKLSLEELSKDLNTACFVAYLTARMSVRSVFTNTSQERAFDEISQMLYKRAINGTPDWWSIAHVHTEREVLENLSEHEKGRLLSETFNQLKEIGEFLETIWRTTNVNRATLIVQRGNDSTTWNQSAGAWNKAREAWVALVYNLGLDSILDTMCPGKVLRLMAADVVHWHSYGKGSLEDALHPDTKVWRDLPAPWDVLSGKAQCPRTLVEQVCDKYAVNRGGWCAPRPAKLAVAYKPTPKLVHGVAVANPHLAKLLRDQGAFSGQGLRGDMVALAMALVPEQIVHDEAGAVIMVKNPPAPTPSGV